MTENAFHFIVDLHRNKRLWKKNDNWEWELKEFVIPENENNDMIERNRLTLLEDFIPFILTDETKQKYSDNKYILIGKGFP